MIYVEANIKIVRTNDNVSPIKIACMFSTSLSKTLSCINRKKNTLILKSRCDAVNRFQNRRVQFKVNIENTFLGFYTSMAGICVRIKAVSNIHPNRKRNLILALNLIPFLVLKTTHIDLSRNFSSEIFTSI